jgi:hypothetical protein
MALIAAKLRDFTIESGGIYGEKNILDFRTHFSYGAPLSRSLSQPILRFTLSLIVGRRLRRFGPLYTNSANPTRRSMLA